MTVVTKYQVMDKEGSLLSGKLSASQGRLSFMELICTAARNTAQWLTTYFSFTCFFQYIFLM